MQNIAGVPLGTRIKAINLVYPYPATMYRENNATVELEPDNVYNVLDLTTVKIPDGYKRLSCVTGWFREPKRLENYLAVYAKRFTVGEFHVGDDAGTADKRRIILEPIKPPKKRFATFEYEIVPNYDGSSITCSEGQAQSWLRIHKNFRIEEREA